MISIPPTARADVASGRAPRRAVALQVPAGAARPPAPAQHPPASEGALGRSHSRAEPRRSDVGPRSVPPGLSAAPAATSPKTLRSNTPGRAHPARLSGFPSSCSSPGAPSWRRCRRWPGGGSRSGTASSRRQKWAPSSAAGRKPRWGWTCASSRGCWRPGAGHRWSPASSSGGPAGRRPSRAPLPPPPPRLLHLPLRLDPPPRRAPGPWVVPPGAPGLGPRRGAREPSRRGGDAPRRRGTGLRRSPALWRPRSSPDTPPSSPLGPVSHRFLAGGGETADRLPNSPESDAKATTKGRGTLIFRTKLVTGLVAPIGKAVATSLLSKLLEGDSLTRPGRRVETGLQVQDPFRCATWDSSFLATIPSSYLLCLLCLSSPCGQLISFRLLVSRSSFIEMWPFKARMFSTSLASPWLLSRSPESCHPTLPTSMKQVLLMMSWRGALSARGRGGAVCLVSQCSAWWKASSSISLSKHGWGPQGAFPGVALGTGFGLLWHPNHLSCRVTNPDF